MSKKMTKKDKPTHAWGIAGLVMGIIGIMLIFIAFPISILFFIIAIVLSIIQRKYEPTSIATAGLIIGIIGIVFYVIIGFASFGESYSTFANAVNA